MGGKGGEGGRKRVVRVNVSRASGGGGGGAARLGGGAALKGARMMVREEVVLWRRKPPKQGIGLSPSFPSHHTHDMIIKMLSKTVKGLWKQSSSRR